jgi:hypothetical protein
MIITITQVFYFIWKICFAVKRTQEVFFMNGCIYVGLLLLAASLLLNTFFHPQVQKSRSLCLLLALTGGISVILQQDSAGLAAVEAVLGLVLIGCTVLSLLTERHDRRAAQITRRRRAERQCWEEERLQEDLAMVERELENVTENVA